MNTKFKVGDKVKLKDPKQFKFGRKVLTVIEADCGDMYIPVTFEGMGVKGYFPLKSCEIEHVSRKGEQLLFFFMTP